MIEPDLSHPPGPRQLAFVTVVYEAEYSLLLLQARSMARYLPREIVDEIVVIDNSSRGIPNSISTSVLREYGSLASLVRFLRPDEIVRMSGAMGWWSQQVLKLCVVSNLTSEKYVVLDAKNHFVAEPTLLNFVSRDGLARVNTHSYEGHRLRPDLENVLSYLGLPFEEYLPNFTATTTPFVFDSALVRELIVGVESKSRRTFAHEIVTKGLTEFFLYTGWVIASGRKLEGVFNVQQQTWPTVWPHSAQSDGVAKAIASANEVEAPIFSVHRRALGVIDDADANLLASWWTDRALFASEVDARQFISDFQSSYRAEAARQRRRDLPNKLLRAPRSFKRRLSRAIKRHPMRPPA